MKLSGPELAVGRIEDRTLPGSGGALAVRIYTPLDAGLKTLPGLVYFHGGGLVAGNVATHDFIGRALAAYGACRVVSVDYRLAPEHPFPAALDDALAAVTHVGAHAARFGIDGARLGICGDSAGAALALGRKHGVELPIATQMDAVLAGTCGAAHAVEELMLRPQKTEQESQKK